MEKEIKLGFSDPPDRIHYLYIGTDDESTVGGNWYEWDHSSNKPVAIPQNSLTGFIKSVFVTKHVWKNKTSYKLNLKINADSTWILRSGMETIFVRGLVLALGLLADEKFDFSLNPVAISIKAGDEEKVKYASVYNYSKGERAFAQWDSEAKLLPIVNKIQKALGVDVQLMDDINKAYDEAQTKYKEREKDNDSSDSKDDDNDIPF